MNERIRELWIEAAEQEPVAKDWPLAPKTGYYNIGGKRVWLEAEAPFPETTPPQRTWVGLTDDEIALINADYPHPQGFAKAIQAKLREKNGWENRVL